MLLLKKNFLFMFQTVENAKEDAHKVFKFLDEYLKTKTYLVGERLTLADICLSMTFYYLFKYVLDNSIRQKYKNLTRWFNTIVNQPQVKKVMGNFVHCDKPLEFDPKKYAEIQGKVLVKI